MLGFRGCTRRAKSIAEADIACVATGADFGIRFTWEEHFALEACHIIAYCRLRKWDLGQQAQEKDDGAKRNRYRQR
jgi:hypothetical protein